MYDGAVDRPLPSGTRWRCQTAWVLLLFGVLSWQQPYSQFGLSVGQEQVFTVLVTFVAFGLAVQTNPTLLVARVPSLLFAGLLVAASTGPGLLGMAPLNSLFLSVRFALVVLTILLLSPVITADPMAIVRTCLFAYAANTLCFLAGGLIAPGRAFLPGTGRLVGLIPPTHPSQVGAFAAVTVGLSVLMMLTGTVGRRLGPLMTVVGVIVLVQSHSRTAALAALLGLLVALASLALQRRSARRLLMILACAGGVIWLVAASAIVSWFARGQTHAELGGFSGRRTVWIAMLEERPTGLTEWLGTGLGDKRYKGKAIDGGWLAAYWQQGVVGVALSALLLLVVAWQAMWSRHSLLRAVTLFLIVFVAVSASSETGISDISTYFLSVMLAGQLAAVRPSVIQGNHNADRRRPQPLPLEFSQWREPGGGSGGRVVASRRS
jgi:hypothetical protein